MRHKPHGFFAEVFNPSTGRLAPFRYELSGIGLRRCRRDMIPLVTDYTR